MIVNEKVYAQKRPYGRLHTNGMSFFVFQPVPVVKDWERDERTFLCTPLGGRVIVRGNGEYVTIYPLPYHVVVSGTWTLELHNEDFIWVETGEVYEEIDIDRLLNINEDLHKASLENQYDLYSVPYNN